jgi:hypothetical protein
VKDKNPLSHRRIHSIWAALRGGSFFLEYAVEGIAKPQAEPAGDLQIKVAS